MTRLDDLDLPDDGYPPVSIGKTLAVIALMVVLVLAVVFA